VNKFVTDRTTGPASTQHGLIPVEIIFADPTISRLGCKQHRLPFTTGFSDTHSIGSIAGRLAEIQAKEKPMPGLAGLVVFELHGKVEPNFQRRDSLECHLTPSPPKWCRWLSISCDKSLLSNLADLANLASAPDRTAPSRSNHREGFADTTGNFRGVFNIAQLTRLWRAYH
jgi:hypothetical protein